MEAPGFALTCGQFGKFSREPLFWSKLLTGTAFAAYAESSGIFPNDPESTRGLEGLWRRREPAPGASDGRRPHASSVLTGVQAHLRETPQVGLGKGQPKLRRSN
jgi:hypothetical protein